MLALTSLATLALPLLASCVSATPITGLEDRSTDVGLNAQSIQLAVASGCSGKGVSAGSVTLSITIPTTLQDVATGLSFFHPPNAAALQVNSASGKDNAAGATRSVTVHAADLGLNSTGASITLSEKIKSVDDFEPFFIDRVWANDGAATVSDGSFTIPSHSSHLVLTPLCRTHASTLTLTTPFCSSDPKLAGALFKGLQEKSVEGFQSLYGEFTSCANV